jgi:hypothetical protein
MARLSSLARWAGVAVMTLRARTVPMLDLPLPLAMRPPPPVHALAAAALLLALGGATNRAAGEAAHPAVLQACPTVHEEIVDLDMLAGGLKKSSAVGLVEKLRLKSSIDELIGRFKAFHGGNRQYTLNELQEQYDLLMMRIARQLQDKDLPLHGQLCNAWGSIWATLQDRGRFMEKFS